MFECCTAGGGASWAARCCTIAWEAGMDVEDVLSEQLAPSRTMAKSSVSLLAWE